MDEELEQPKKKITLSNFFESIKSIDAVANNALKIANSNLSIIQEQKSIIEGLSQSLEALQTEIQEINNYIIIEKNEREDRLFEEEDRRQKEEMSQRRAAEGEKGERGPRGPQGTQGESEEKKEPQQPQGGGGGGILGAIGGVFGGLRDALGPLALGLGANIFTGFRGGGPIGAIAGALGFGRSGAKGFEAQDKLRNKKENLFGDNQKITKPRGLTGIFGGMADALTGGRTDFDGRGSGEKENVKEEIKSEIKSEIKEELNLSGGAKDGEKPIITSKKLNTRFDIKTGKAYVNDQEVDPQRYAEFKRLSKKEQADQGLDFFNEDTKDKKDIKSQNKSKNLKGEKRGIKGVIGGVADSLTSGFFNFGKKKKVEGDDVVGFNKGGEVEDNDKDTSNNDEDSVPALLTPGEFVIKKDAVEKVGVETLEGINASFGKEFDMSDFEPKQKSIGGVDMALTETKDGKTTKRYMSTRETRKFLKDKGIPAKELINGMVIPDMAKVAAAEVPKTYEFMIKTIRETVSEDKQGPMIAELDKFMQNFVGSGGDFRDTSDIEAEMNRYIPGTIENLGEQITQSTRKFKPQKFSEGGLVGESTQTNIKEVAEKIKPRLQKMAESFRMDEKIPNMLKGIATGIGEKNPELPSQIKDTVIKSVTGMGKEKLVNPLMQMIESKAEDNPILQMIMNNSEVSQNTLAQQSADAAFQNNSTDRNPSPGVLVQPEPSVGASIEIKPTSPEIPFIKLMTGMTKKYSLTSTSNKSMLPPEIAARIQ